MKGVVLAGGTGSRLYPMTRVTNKHLMPVYSKPLLYYPIQTLLDGGVEDILIMLGGNSVGDVIRLMGDGSEFGARFTYKLQEGPLGIAHALGLARDFVGNDTVALVLGDNVFLGDVLKDLPEDGNAMVYLTESDTPQRFGVAKFNSKGQLTGIVEKPKKAPSNQVVTGLYVYPPDVFSFIDTLEPSARGELEITDVNNWFLREGRLEHSTLSDRCQWHDAGTFESLYAASTMVRDYEQGRRNYGGCA